MVKFLLAAMLMAFAGSACAADLEANAISIAARRNFTMAGLP